MRRLIPSLAAAALFSACGREPSRLPLPPQASETPPPSATNANAAAIPGGAITNQPAVTGRPQPKLPALKLWLGSKEIEAEIALTVEQIRTGMMFRTEMEENEGMLFVFARPSRVAFYMRNTLIPLSCAYIDSEGVLLEIHPMTPLDETPIDASSDRVQYVLEMRQGWFERHNVQPGAVVRSERGSLHETFFGRRPQ